VYCKTNSEIWRLTADERRVPGYKKSDSGHCRKKVYHRNIASSVCSCGEPFQWSANDTTLGDILAHDLVVDTRPLRLPRMKCPVVVAVVTRQTSIRKGWFLLIHARRTRPISWGEYLTLDFRTVFRRMPKNHLQPLVSLSHYHGFADSVVTFKIKGRTWLCCRMKALDYNNTVNSRDNDSSNVAFYSTVAPPLIFNS